MKITRETSKQKHEEYISNMEPYRAEFAAAKELYSIANDRLIKPVYDLLEQFYDQELVDANQEPIKVGYKITDGKYVYSVYKRTSQVLFGEFLCNASVLCKKVVKEGQRPVLKDYDFGPFYLKDFTIVSRQIAAVVPPSQ